MHNIFKLNIINQKYQKFKSKNLSYRNAFLAHPHEEFLFLF